ncbi:GNAT family N-acetyltransferase [Nitrospina watsonii]|uniref:GCN5-related N-acetyltransferase n=1 Tax=Nitrospina watsonii TaxID=1323948 RepID=A0ABM9HAG6_9BACT|nr:GNAT family N-acetyltransferase [Nitrospina watsonii]CAI2717124.1 GCN5-related N-acetyltransferase [Nitrospina watsonii]
MASEYFPFSAPLLTFEGYRIRRFTPADAAALAEYGNNYRIWQQLRDWFPHPYTQQHADDFIDQASREYPPRTFAIATDREAIGTIGYHPGQDVNRHAAELGFWLAQPYHGKGIMTAAVQGFADHLLQHEDLIRVFAAVFAGNPASRRVLEKAGFVLEGVLQCSVVKKRIACWTSTCMRRFGRTP